MRERRQSRIRARHEPAADYRRQAIVPVQDGVWNDVHAFYEQRQGAAAWWTRRARRRPRMCWRCCGRRPAWPRSGEVRRAAIVERIEALKSSKDDAPGRLQQIAELDAPDGFAPGVRPRRGNRAHAACAVWKEPSRGAGPCRHARSGRRRRSQEWVETIRPRHPEYTALQDALVKLQGQREKGGWSAVPSANSGSGRARPSIVALRQRLAAGGHLSAAAASNTSAQYTSDDEKAVRAFQALHALPAIGVADPATLSAMNVPIDDRIRQVELNLERWRWMPDDFGAQHLFVNIPYFHLVARENGKAVKDVRVVVGKPATRPPSSAPTWRRLCSAPTGTSPTASWRAKPRRPSRAIPAYLTKNNIEILDVSNRRARRRSTPPASTGTTRSS